MTRSYYPALLVGWLTPAYDLFVRMLLREKQFKCQLIGSARIAPGQRVLDVGAGTGTLAIMIKQAHPNAEVTGLDGDPTVLAIARQKASRARATSSPLPTTWQVCYRRCSERPDS